MAESDGVVSDLEQGCLKSVVLFFLFTASVGLIAWEWVIS